MNEIFVVKEVGCYNDPNDNIKAFATREAAEGFIKLLQTSKKAYRDQGDVANLVHSPSDLEIERVPYFHA